MTMRDDYHARADEARREARTSTLANVRDKLLRSANAWDQMAQREDRIAAARQARADEQEAKSH